MNERALADRLDAIDRSIAEILSELRRRRRDGAKRSVTVARRVAAAVQHEPNELQRKKARAALMRAQGRR